MSNSQRFYFEVVIGPERVLVIAGNAETVGAVVAESLPTLCERISYYRVDGAHVRIGRAT